MNDNTNLCIDINYVENISFDQNDVNNMTTDVRRKHSTSEIHVAAADNKHGYEPILMSIDVEPHDDLLASDNNMIRKTAAITNDLAASGQINRLTLGESDRPVGEAFFRNTQNLVVTNQESVMTANFDKSRNTFSPSSPSGTGDEDIK